MNSPYQTLTTDPPHTLEELTRLTARVESLEAERRRLVALLEILRDVTGAPNYTDILQSVTRRLGPRLRAASVNPSSTLLPLYAT